MDVNEALIVYELAKDEYDEYVHWAVGEDYPPLCADKLRDAAEAVVEALMVDVTTPPTDALAAAAADAERYRAALERIVVLCEGMESHMWEETVFSIEQAATDALAQQGKGEQP